MNMTDEEREALAAIIAEHSYDGGSGPIDGSTLDEMNEEIADVILAAGYRLPPAGDAWEYRRVMPDGGPRYGATFDTLPELDEGWGAERRWLGPWLPVSPEGVSE